MARGKHKQAASSRRTAALEAAIASCRAELRAEQELLAITQVEAARIDGRRALLEQLRAEQAAVTAPEATYLDGQIAALHTAVTAETMHRDTLSEHWGPFCDRLLDMFGGRIDGWEMLIELFSGERGTIALDTARRGLNQDAVRALQYARGDRLRRRTPSLIDRTRHPLDGLLPADLADRLTQALTDHAAGAALDEAATGEVTDDAAGTIPTGTDSKTADTSGIDAETGDLSRVDLPGITDAGWNSITHDAVATWHPMPWLTDALWARPSPAAEALGVPAMPDTADRTDLAMEQLPEPVTYPPPTTSADVPEPMPAMSHSARARLAAAEPHQVMQAWARHLGSTASSRAQQLMHPLGDWPARPSATIATSLAHWYTLAGLGTWQRARAIGDPRADLFGEVAIGCAAAAPFWLPTAQTVDFFDSEPLTDFDDLRLPFPQVLLTFAEPIELPTVGAIDPDAAPALGVLDAAMLTERRHLSDHGPYRLLSAASAHLFGAGFTATFQQAIADRGARVEAILLLGDSLGRLSETIAWALAVPAANGGVLARALVPAHWPDSIWRDQILNAAAVTAWADWHAPDDPIPDGSRDVSAGPGDLGQPGDRVYVLAVRATRARSVRSEPTGRQLPAHLRRGHWRRQHHGPRGELVKRVRIAPTVVNANRHELATRIYRLPSA